MSSMFNAANTSLMNVVIRADAGPAVGTGHVMRMMALAEACCKLGARVSMLCGVLPGGLVQRLTHYGVDVHQLESSQCDASDAQETLKTAAKLDADWIVLDGYGFDRQYQQAMSTADATVMMMEDAAAESDCLADHEFVDVIVNQNVYASGDNDNKRFQGGCQFTLLRSEFLSQAALDVKPIRQLARRVLVTLGGCDDANWTSRVLRSLSFSGSQKLIVDVVVGAGYQHRESLNELKRELPFSIRIHQNVDRMVDIMRQVDFAITAGGSTCYELARCGVPALAIPVAPNQLPIVDALEQHGTLVGFEPIADDEECIEVLSDAVRSLLRDPQARTEMSETGRELVDGKGAFRIARRMANWGLTFREAKLEDASKLLSWRNDPEVRSVSFHSDVMDEESFRIWFEEQLENKNSRLWIAQSQRGVPIGKVHVNFDDPRQAAIELTLDHARRGKGLGRTIIEQICQMTFDESPLVESVIARISPGNVASERAFRSVGFVQTQPTMINKKLAFQFILWRESRSVSERSAA